MSSLMSPRSPIQRARQSNRLKSVTFTGCWTCRSRKVKCDERQEDGCRVCQHAGLTCAGYAVTLSWVTDEKQRPAAVQRSRRRKIHPDQSGLSLLSDDDLSRILSSLDAISDLSTSDTVSMGPFSLFSAQSNHASPLLVHQTLTDGDFPFGQDPLGQNEGPTTLSGEDGYSASICEDGTASLNIESSLHSPERAMLDHSKPTTWPTTSLSPAGQSQFSLDHDDHSSWRLPDEGQVIRALEDREREEQIEEANFQIFDLQPPAKRRRLLSPHKHELSMPLYQDQHTSMLLHHYMNHVADLFQPILHPRNPWRTIYFPFALQGCPELFLAQNPTPSSRASISLFHSLLSSAAFHLNNATNTSPIFRTLGIRHRIKALRALKSIPIHAINQELYTEYLTAMLALVTIDTMVEEDASEFPVHLDGCKQLRQFPDFVTVPSHTNSQVRSICNVLTLLARTTSHNLEPLSWKSRENLSSGPLHFLSNDRSVEYIYGVTPILGNLLRNTCDIRQHLAFYEGGHIPPDLVTECETLRDELLTWHIDSESFCLIKSDEQTNLEIVRCQARAFHAAILIFYYRTIDNYKDPVIIQRRVRSIWINLTQAENLKEDCMGANKRTAPMSWPAFIASCEATDRQPWVEWWTRAQGYGIGNFRRQWQIIQQVWAILDVDENVTDWRDALRQTGKLILPI